jgi:hypothetical protein
MLTKALYLLPTSPSHWRNGKRLKIIGVVSVIPNKGLTSRPCYHVIDEDDGQDDYFAISGYLNSFILVTKDEVVD